MPFYEYQCQGCGAHHEAMQKMSDPPLKKCPACGKPRLKRLISAPVFRLKGSGWYETDFKSDKETKRNLHGEEAKGEAAAPAEKKAAEPAAKAENAKAEPAKAAAKPSARPAKKAPAKARKPAKKAPRRR